MKRLLVTLSVAVAFWSAACGSAGSSVQPPPPSGKYSLASLNGTYAFVTNGEVIAGNAVSPMARAGSFIANGQGVIMGGVEDVNISGTPSGAALITGGSYTVNPDGRGVITLAIGQSSITLGIVLTSTSDGLLIDETSTASQFSTGSGNFVLQNPAVCSSPVTSIVAGTTYVFDLAGLDANGFPESFVGEFTANNGATTANFGDVNDNAALTNGSFTASFATASLPPAGPNACGRGLAQITAATGPQTYAYYVVNSTRIRLINAAGGEMLSGDAVAQSSNVPTSTSNFNGGFAFVLAGASTNGGVTRVGRFTANGATVSNVLGDTNDAGMQHPSSSFSNGAITFDSANPGRGQITFQDPSFPFTFVFYLSSASSGVIQDVTQSSPGVGIVVADGSLESQSGGLFTSANISGTYAMNWSGLVTSGGNFATQDEEDLLAQTTVTNLALSGTADLFQFTTGTLRTDLGVGGVIQINGDGTSGDGNRNGITVNLTGTNKPIDCVVYFINLQTAFFANRDNSGAQRIVVGILKLQQ